jgi:hypothetical protein
MSKAGLMPPTIPEQQAQFNSNVADKYNALTKQITEIPDSITTLAQLIDYLKNLKI